MKVVGFVIPNFGVVRFVGLVAAVGRGPIVKHKRWQGLVIGFAVVLLVVFGFGFRSLARFAVLEVGIHGCNFVAGGDVGGDVFIGESFAFSVDTFGISV